MAPVDLKLRILLDSNDLSALPAAMREAHKKVQVENEKAAKTALSGLDKAEKERIAIQNKYSGLEMRDRARKRAEIERETKSQADTVLRLERQAAQAQASLVVDRFDRRISVERAKHAQAMVILKGNNAAQEAEMRRHSAVIARITMDKANFPNTPFQQLLGHLSNVTSQMGIQLPSALQTATVNMRGAQAGAASLGIVMAGAGASILALGAASAYAYSQAREQADADNRLRAILKSTGQAAGVTMEQLQAMAGAYQELTDFSDDAVQGAEAVLLRFGSIGSDIFPEALKATLDLASVTGNLSGAASDLGQALEKPEDAARKLKSMDILLTDSQKKLLQQLVDTGEKAEAQKFILDAVAKSYGGNAEAMSHETTKLGNRIGELAERLGKGLVPIVDFAAGALNDMITPEVMKKPKEYWDAQKLGAMGFTLALEDAAALAGKVAPKKEKVLSDDQKERLVAMQRDVDRARIEAMDDSAAKSIAIEKLEHEKRLKELGAFGEAVALENQLYAAKVGAINADAAKERLDAQADVQNKVLESQREHQAKIREAHKREHDEAVAADEKRTAQIYAARDQIAEARAEGDPMALLELKQKREIELARSDTERKDLQALHDIQRNATLKRSEADLFTAKAGYYSQYANSVGQLVGIMGGKSKAAFAIQKGVALGEIAIRTAAAVVEDNSRLVTAWKVPYDIALGASQAAIVSATALKGFRTGGYTGAGNPGDVAGIVHRDEYVVNHDDLRRAGGPRGIESMLRGDAGGGRSTNQVNHINISLSGSATPADASRVADAVEQRLRGLVEDLETIDYRGMRKRGRVAV